MLHEEVYLTGPHAAERCIFLIHVDGVEPFDKIIICPLPLGLHRAVVVRSAEVCRHDELELGEPVLTGNVREAGAIGQGRRHNVPEP